MKRVEERIGNTPLSELVKTERQKQLKAKIFAKLERENPGGSIKDRVAKAILDDAERTGRLRPGGTVIEATSGNTGIGLALVCKARGYKAVIVMSETMSVERQQLIKSYGAEILLTAGAKGMQGAVEKAEALQKSIPNSVIADQFNNPVCATVHYRTTAAEIDRQTDGKADIFVICVGTGGTLTGIGRYWKEKNPQVQVIAVEPASSPLLSKGIAGAHKIQGIGANFVPTVLDRKVYDEVVTVTDDEAMEATRYLQKEEGMYVGISSGAAYAAAVKVAQRAENEGKRIVTVFPDDGGRYESVLK